MHLWSHSFGNYPRFMTTGENGDKNCFENWELCLFRQFSFYDNRVVQSSHYCIRFAYSSIQFFILPSVTRQCNPKITQTFLPASVLLHLLVARTDQGFLKDEVPQFWQHWFSFRRCFMHLQSYFTCAGGQIVWKKAEPNHQRIADAWFCNFQSWHTLQLGCICRSNSCKQWQGELTKRTLAVVQRLHGAALIACYLSEHKPLVGSRMTWWHVTTDHQRFASSKPSKVYPEELDHMLFQDRQSMQRDFCHTP